ncbi:MAG: alanine--tRNA ligase [Dehalococcoidia bacterium]|nr:alanine--tRNA ligase [Dehalococcoidia bacterium]MCB9484900.1 alanine--tRNA ligase [Thermoflexaceae bacterium]
MTSQPRTSDEIRSAFLNFFEERGHLRLPGWPLVPIGDPTSLFTSAGMQQFKPVFLGEQDRPAPSVTTVQRCFRTTDIEEVGDYSHLTMFEMLGNFSFGDYFKQGAIEFAWDLLTNVYNLPAERLYITIFLTDEEAYEAWRSVGVPDERIFRCDEEKNYWFGFANGTPGASGPCGPDTEIYFDMTPEAGPFTTNVAYDERFLEIWNLVFMELYQAPDGTRTGLPTKNIDTGSGLERVACAIQGKRSVYETDIFLPILEEAARVVGIDYFELPIEDARSYAVRAMAEHCRAAAMLVSDGVVPSNEGRGYILRRILRRAIYLARQAGVRDIFTARVAGAAIDKLEGAYPHMSEGRAFVERALTTEEERFVRTLEAGMHRLGLLLDALAPGESLPGQDAFVLYDTFGFPLELTREVAAAREIIVDEPGFNLAMDEQRRRSREHGRFLKGEPSPLIARIGEEHSAFVGYQREEGDAQIVAILLADQLATAATQGQVCEIVLDQTPFYPEGGGQVGDHGQLRTATGIFEVEDTQATGGAIIHRGRVTEGEIRLAQPAAAIVDPAFRVASARNHTGTHLLHAALRSILGTHVRQQGSLVARDRLRFDFTHLEQVPRQALRESQQLVNEKVRRNLEVGWRLTSYRNAIAGGALAFFGDKYGSEVRVVEIRDDSDLVSAELCGGTHVHHTGEIGFLHILRESSVAAGTRRVEALTGSSAEEYLLDQQERLFRLADRLSTAPSDLEDRIEGLQSEIERLRRQAEQLARVQVAAVADGLVDAAARVAGTAVAVSRVDVSSADSLREVADRVRQRLGSSVLVLAAVIDGRPAFLAAATPDLVERGLHAGNIVREVAKVAGGGGGGSPALAQAGAKDASSLDAALAQGRRIVATALGTEELGP